MKTPPIAIIVAALLPEFGIGFQGKLPWRLKQEIKYFKDVTTYTSSPSSQNAVIMGRKTWESIPLKFRPLPGRINVILSRSHKNTVQDDGTILATSLDDALATLDNHDIEKIYIIGGAELYNQILKDKRLTHILLTEINSNAHIEMDRFINLDTKDWGKKSDTDLKNFIGKDSDIDIPELIEEGEYRYKYTLWTRN